MEYYSDTERNESPMHGYSMDEPWNVRLSEKVPFIKDLILYDSIYVKHTEWAKPQERDD